MNDNVKISYPRTLTLEDGDVQLRYMTADDEGAVLSFAQSLDPHDLLFMRRNITNPKVVGAWARQAVAEELITLLAIRDTAIVGCVAIVRDELSWSPHVGELRLVVGGEMRGKGLGRILTQECFALAIGLGLEKLVAFMTVDQRAAISVFEGLGFKAEAVLREHVKDLSGAKHDVVVLGHDVEKYLGRMEAYGVVGSL